VKSAQTLFTQGLSPIAPTQNHRISDPLAGIIHHFGAKIKPKRRFILVHKTTKHQKSAPQERTISGPRRSSNGAKPDIKASKA
jgi:hypothetical protein